MPGDSTRRHQQRHLRAAASEPKSAARRPPLRSAPRALAGTPPWRQHETPPAALPPRGSIGRRNRRPVARLHAQRRARLTKPSLATARSAGSSATYTRQHQNRHQRSSPAFTLCAANARPTRSLARARNRHQQRQGHVEAPRTHVRPSPWREHVAPPATPPPHGSTTTPPKLEGSARLAPPSSPAITGFRQRPRGVHHRGQTPTVHRQAHATPNGRRARTCADPIHAAHTRHRGTAARRQWQEPKPAPITRLHAQRRARLTNPSLATARSATSSAASTRQRQDQPARKLPRGSTKHRNHPRPRRQPAEPSRCVAMQWPVHHTDGMPMRFPRALLCASLLALALRPSSCRPARSRTPPPHRSRAPQLRAAGGARRRGRGVEAINNNVQTVVAINNSGPGPFPGDPTTITGNTPR